MDKNQQTPQKSTVRLETNTPQDTKNDMKKVPSSSLATVGLIAAVALVVLAGVSTGYALAQNRDGLKSVTTGGVLSDSKVGSIAGELEEGVSYDEAEGTLVVGGIGTEGSHHLERPGGESQHVYLTSSSVDLSMYEGKDVKVWGVTFDAQKAGWLMDVAKLEVK